MSNVASLNVVWGAGLKSSKFLTWTDLRQSVLLKLCYNMPNLKAIFDLEKFKCRDYYFYLMKQKYEKPRKWRKLKCHYDQIFTS